MSYVICMMKVAGRTLDALNCKMIINFVLHTFHYLSNITPKFRVVVFVCNMVSNLPCVLLHA